MDNILQNILDTYPKLSKKHQILASYILKSTTEVAFMTSVELAKATGVSNATITRFVIALGYSGFNEFQQNIQNNALNHLSSLDQLKNVTQHGDEVFESMLEALTLIPTTYAQRDTNAILEAADLIERSEKVFVTGYQWSKALVESTVYELEKYTDGVYPILENSFANYNLVNENPENSCAIVFAIPRYPTKTIQQIKKFEKLNIPIILFTDEVFPYAKKAKCLFTIQLFGMSLPTVLPLVIIMLIVQEIISRVIINNPKNAQERVEKFEKSAIDKYMSIEELV